MHFLRHKSGVNRECHLYILSSPRSSQGTSLSQQNSPSRIVKSIYAMRKKGALVSSVACLRNRITIAETITADAPATAMALSNVTRFNDCSEGFSVSPAISASATAIGSISPSIMEDAPTVRSSSGKGP
mmetsp:Transcript_124838/g.219845  ORF Transcript_124838/g.219845 Transcript_124838/m.219845 type:complete len:129 (-) Transcript_124838:24-410(-)